MAAGFAQLPASPAFSHVSGSYRGLTREVFVLHAAAQMRHYIKLSSALTCRAYGNPEGGSEPFGCLQEKLSLHSVLPCYLSSFGESNLVRFPAVFKSSG